MERENIEQVPGKELPIVMAVGGLLCTAIFTSSLVVGHITDKFQEVASYPGAVISASVCVYGIKRLVSSRQ